MVDSIIRLTIAAHRARDQALAQLGWNVPEVDNRQILLLDHAVINVIFQTAQSDPPKSLIKWGLAFIEVFYSLSLLFISGSWSSFNFTRIQFYR